MAFPVELHLIAAIEGMSVERPYFPMVPAEVLGQALKTRHGDKSMLTFREREVIQLIAEGRQNKEVADSLDLSVKTVECHRAAVMQKLDIRNTAQLVRYALGNAIA